MPESHEAPATSKGLTSAVQWLTALGMAVAVGMLALGTTVLLDARKDAWQKAEQASANLVLALEQDIARNIGVYDLSLQGAIEALQQPDINKVSAEIRQIALFDRAASAEYLGSVLVLDAAGNITADSTSLTPHSLNLADRDYFRVHQDKPGIGLYLSRPYRSRLRDDDPSIAISRRLLAADGHFARVARGALRLSYFQDLFKRIDLGPGGSIFLMRTDGRVLRAILTERAISIAT